MFRYIMRVKVHFLHSHVDYFPDNLGTVSEEQDTRVHEHYILSESQKKKSLALDMFLHLGM